MRGKVQDEAGDYKEHSGQPGVAQRPLGGATYGYELQSPGHDLTPLHAAV